MGAQVGTCPTLEPPCSSLGKGLMTVDFGDHRQCWHVTATASYTKGIYALVHDDHVPRRGEPIAS